MVGDTDWMAISRYGRNIYHEKEKDYRIRKSVRVKIEGWKNSKLEI